MILNIFSPHPVFGLVAGGKITEHQKINNLNFLFFLLYKTELLVLLFYIKILSYFVSFCLI